MQRTRDDEAASLDPPLSPLERTLRAYDESLLRRVAGQLVKPRNQWPVDELIARCLGAFDNIASIDRRLKELNPAERRLLALIAHSGQPRWQVVHLVEMATALDDPDGLQSVRNLLEAGLLYPELPETWKRLRSFNQWFSQVGSNGLTVFTPASVLGRAQGEELGLPSLPTHSSGAAGIVHEADGLEWPLRLAVVWQLVAAEPLRRTQQGEFFKRDQERLRNDPLLTNPPTDSLAELPEAAFLTAELALALGILRDVGGEWRAEELPPSWNQRLTPTLASLWAVLPRISFPGVETRQNGESNPIPSAALLSLLSLAQLPASEWTRLRDLENWISAHHPFWKKESKPRSAKRQHKAEDIDATEMVDAAPRPAINHSPLPTNHSAVGAFLLTIAYQLRLIQVGRAEDGEWLVRLSPIGRWLLGLGPEPVLPDLPSQTLLVQPNLEIVAYRQGLTPGLIRLLSQFAAWKSLGAACLLQVQPETVYRALESGLTFDGIQQALERYGTRPTPPAVLDMLRTWTAKRDRLSLYPSATLFEFLEAKDLDDALARGLPATRLSDRLAVVKSESEIDYRHFRLGGTRDYALPPERCVDIDSDGVTLTIDQGRSDLLVETELRRFARFLDQPSNNGKRQYHVTSASLAEGQNGGLGIHVLEEWFQQRTGRSLTPAVRLLMTAPYQPAVELKQQLILQVASPEAADGLLQLTETRSLIQGRLGPTSLVIAPEHLEELRRRMEQLGLAINQEPRTQ